MILVRRRSLELRQRQALFGSRPFGANSGRSHGKDVGQDPFSSLPHTQFAQKPRSQVDHARVVTPPWTVDLDRHIERNLTFRKNQYPIGQEDRFVDVVFGSGGNLTGAGPRQARSR